MWPSLAQRATQPERLDLGVPAPEALASLHDLRFVNRWLGARRALVRAVASLLDGVRRPALLDVGCGSADIPDLLRRRLGNRPLAVGLDIKALHLRLTPRGVRGVVGDVRALPFAPASFDVVTASLFLHHFDTPELPEVLRALFALARRGLVVSDLRRARVPWLFGQVAFRMLFRAPVSVHDGLLSIRRGFTDAELRAAFAAAGIANPTLARHFPYRLVAVARTES